MTTPSLIKLAASLCRSKKISDNTSGDVGCALLSEKGNVYVLHPCGRCREFMRQIDKHNMETEVILGKDRSVKLKELLPYDGDFSKV
ncbi:MAG: hypothetical protein ABH856_01815 [Patescibacteria group bacterium]|nr:hypothetical protein [Patescibacteria group bacterium]